MSTSNTNQVVNLKNDQYLLQFPIADQKEETSNHIKRNINTKQSILTIVFFNDFDEKYSERPLIKEIKSSIDQNISVIIFRKWQNFCGRK